MLRRNSYKPVILIFLYAYLLTGLFACVPAGTPRGSVDVLRVGVAANSPPLIFKSGKKVTGLETDLAVKLASYMGKKATFIDMDWDDLIPALEADKIDIIMSAMSITQARQYRIAFSNPYLRSGQILLVRLQEKARFTTGIYSLMNSNYVIGTVKNTTGDLFITSTINGVTIKRFAKSAMAVQALIDKEIDAFVYDAPMVCHIAAINENTKLAPILTLATEEYLAWGIRKDNIELLKQSNAFLVALQERQELLPMIRARIPFM